MSETNTHKTRGNEMINLKEAIKKVAEEENLTEIEIITLLQSQAARKKDDKLLDELCEIKSEIIDKQFF
jgi:hypothetical protein